MNPVLVTAPTGLPVTRAQLKSHLNVTHDSDDTLLDDLLSAATAHLDGPRGILGRCLLQQVWRQDFADWPARRLDLPFPDVSAVVLKYSDAADSEQTVSAGLYQLLADSAGSYLRFRDGFAAPALYADRADPVRVTVTAGFGASAGDVPSGIRHAILLLAAHWYASREAVAGGSLREVPMGVAELLGPWRTGWVA